MKSLSIINNILIFCCLAIPCFSSDASEGVLNDPHAAELRYRMLADASSKMSPLSFQYVSGPDTRTKSPALGILMSIAVPGAGEMYAGSWIKGAVFLGVEIGLWIGYFQLQYKGDEWERVFIEFADTHWDEDRWRTWMDLHPEFTDTTHTLPSTKTQQYYEMIGKYDQFKAGWDDYYDGGPKLTPHRDRYMDQRLKSNLNFKGASYCVMVTLANRVLSAFDTAFTIRGVNREFQGKMRMSMKRVHEFWVPNLTLGVKW